jgi:CRP/FNR family transcriptional regulator
MDTACKRTDVFFAPENTLELVTDPSLEATFFSDRARKHNFLAKDVIYHEGDSIDKVYTVRSGMVKLLSYLPNGRARIVRLHAKGHWLGLEGLARQRYAHTALAVGYVEVASRPLSSLNQLLRDQPRYYSQVLQQVHEHLAQADRWIADFSTGGIKSRVARLVDFLAKLEHGEVLNIVELLSVHEMADMLGVTPESVSRIMAEFKRNHTLHKQASTLYETYKIDSMQLQQEARQ